ncbi:nima-interacting protein [Niveomyces insectorum RCEF 264]|uniref:Nima-interacting protein n=1 Tax=Niveomyces insectorum RCEF 264 TaxID=1081102 RepID=A0A167VIS1_9HYPO|nr:nima-interacting protein [Niveomyces insectorum RCEF 264]
MASFKPSPLLLGLCVFLLLVRRVHAFGAGNIAGISKVEGQNWRHGDIEDTLLTLLMARAAGGKRFDKLTVSRVYFGNWLRDYSQAIDVATVKSVSAEAIRLLLCVLGFLSFGYGSREFEVTAERLGCYRPEDHIDNPKGYAEGLDARRYDPRLRGPVDDRVELGIDPASGMKNYIANERANIMTSAYHVRQLFGRCIDLGRAYRRTRREADLHEALRLMGTGLHCLEDFLAHSNYTELALIEMGETEVFPHVGRNTRLRLAGASHAVYPVVTGTFGGVDFLHSVTGEVSDKMTQNEVQELEGTLQNSQKSDTSMLQNVFDMLPSGLLGGGDKKQKMHDIQDNATAAQMQQMSVSPREPEAFAEHIKNVFNQIMPAIEFHDEILQKITEAIEKIPVLPQLIEQLEDQLSVFVFSVIAPFVVPVIQQIQNEMQTGSSEIIQSSKDEQLVVFNDDYCSDPTHSMLSKDHFSNILNEIAGRTAGKVVAWVVPQLMEAWDNDNVDIPRTLNRIVYGVLHHPAQRHLGEDGARDGRGIMFSSVEEWWRNMPDEQRDEYREKLSRDGVERGDNHKEGVYDTGHGCCKPLGMQKNFSTSGGGSGSGIGGALGGGVAGMAAGAILGELTNTGGSSQPGAGELGGLLGSLGGIGGGGGGGGGGSGFGGNDGGGAAGLGGLLGAAGSLLGAGFSESTVPSVSTRREADGGYSETYTQYGRNDEGDRFAQAEFTRTDYADGEERTDYRRYEQDELRPGQQTTGFGYEERTDAWPTSSGSGGGSGYEQRTERRWEDSSGRVRQEEESETFSSLGSRGWGGGQQREERYEERYEERGQQEGWGQEGGRRQQNQQYGQEEEYAEERRDDWSRPQEEEEQRGGGGGGLGGFLGEIVQEAESAFEEDDDRRQERRGGWGF